tara:strand:+ start:1564 stop:2166 length:603 start_codon:yes stop_codon:yes gene_type:complete
MLKALRILICSSIIFSSPVVFAGALESLYFPNLNIVNTLNGELEINNHGIYNIKYEIYHEELMFSDRYLVDKVQKNVSLLIDFSKTNHFDISNDCRSRDIFEIYDLSVSTLNSESFESLPTGKNRWGLFTILPEEEYRVAMIITHHQSIITNEALIAHEVAHYFWDRFCIWRSSSVTSEEFSQRYELYYRELITDSADAR